MNSDSVSGITDDSTTDLRKNRDNDKLIKKTHKNRIRRNEIVKEEKQSNNNNFEYVEMQDKPPMVSSKSSLRTISNQNLKEEIKSDENESRPSTNRTRSNSRVRKTKAKAKGNTNEAYESDTQDKQQSIAEDQEEKSKKTKIKKKKKQANETKEKDPYILAIIIHESGRFRTDINLYHPLIKIHLVDLNNNGQYIRKLDKNRHVNCFYEKNNSNTDYIMPVLTTPFDFKANKSLVPKWDEILLFNESYEHFIKDNPNTLILFEILDSQKTYHPSEFHTTAGRDEGWMRIAWAFLKLVGSDKSPNTEKRIKLQLYYSPTYVSQVTGVEQIPQVYNLYKNGPRVKYPSTLTITVKAVLQPNNFEPSLRSYYTFQEGREVMNDDNANTRNEESFKENIPGSKNLIDIDDKPKIDSNNRLRELERRTVLWSRAEGQPCRIPNDTILSLPSGKNGCYSIRFSRSGSYLACACVEDNNVCPILIYEIPSGLLCAKFSGHFGLVYTLDWSKYDKYLLTASNDATARVYDFMNKSKDAFKILPHPTFIYSAKFHPSIDNVVVTGGYDKSIRVWSINKPGKYGLLKQELFGHFGFINSICFSHDAAKVFSADSNGCILVWNCFEDDDKLWKQEGEITIEEIQNTCINHIELHPNHKHMIVHTRDNQIRLIDVRIQSVIQNYIGSLSYNDFMRSSITPCGTFVFTPGADTKSYCWNIETGDSVTPNGINLNYLKPARDIHYHPFDHMIAYCSYGSHAPVYVFKYDKEKPSRPVTDSRSSLRIPTASMLNKSSSKSNVVLDDDVLQEKVVNSVVNEDHRSNRNEILRLKKVQEQLDSIYTNVANLSLASSAKRNLRSELNEDYTNTLLNRPHMTSSLTLSMNTDRPEFRYNGPKETQDLVVAIYNYTAQRSDELSFEQGDEIYVLIRDSPKWWMGELKKNRKQGYFPPSYVQETFESNQTSKKNSKLTVKDLFNEESFSTTITKAKYDVINEIPEKDRPDSASKVKFTRKSVRVNNDS